MESKITETIRKRYNRIAPLYDLMEGFAERSSFGKWRKLLWGKVEGTNILEIGVGTGKNFPYYPKEAGITAIDFSEKMLERARKKAGQQGIKVNLLYMDAQDLRFPDNTFDTVAATFVFCSVPDPIRSLVEIKRVLKLGGKVVLLEHVLSENRVVARLMNIMNPLVVRIMGANVNRKTVENVSKAGLSVERVSHLGHIFRLIEARNQRG